MILNEETAPPRKGGCGLQHGDKASPAKGEAGLLFKGIQTLRKGGTWGVSPSLWRVRCKTAYAFFICEKCILKLDLCDKVNTLYSSSVSQSRYTVSVKISKQAYAYRKKQKSMRYNASFIWCGLFLILERNAVELGEYINSGHRPATNRQLLDNIYPNHLYG